MPLRKVRVTRNNMQLRYRADCRHCHHLVYFVNDEEFLWDDTLARGVPRNVLHNCPKLDGKQRLLHNGRKPR